MVFKINLATRIYLNTRLLTLSIGAAVVVLLSLLAANCVTFAKNAAEMKTLSGQIAALDAKFANASQGVSEHQYRDLLARVNFANAVIEKKAYNWQMLLDKLELVVPDGVAVSSLMPDPKTGELKLSGVARTFGNLRTFMERLEESAFFTGVYLVSEGETKLGDKSSALNFAITCKVTIK
jgi:type IV pilus assembly protein PilN